MRIGIDARFFGGEQSKGLGRYTQKLIEQLAEHDGPHTYVIFLQPESLRLWKAPNDKFSVVVAPYHWYSFAEQLGMPWKIWRARVDVMHFPHFNVPLLYRKPFIVTIHDLIINHFPTERATTLGPFLYTFKHLAGQWVMRHAVRFSQRIITVSEFSKHDIVNYYGIDPQKVVVTYEAADPVTPAENTNAKQILERYRIRKPYLLYIGNAYPHKNLEMMIDVLKELKRRQQPIPWQMVFVGREDYFYARLKQHAWSKNVDDHTVFTGFVPDSELSVLYAHAEAYVFPSLYEGFGLPPLEAMTQRTPVLSANTSCLPEILGDAAEYFDPADVSAIIDAIQRVMHNTERRQTLIQNGDVQVRQYSWHRMMQQTLNVYAEYELWKEKQQQKKKNSSRD